MKLPRFSLREMFWITLVVALGLGWWVDRTRLMADYWATVHSMAKSKMYQMDLTLSLQAAIQKEGYQLHWSDEQVPRAILHRQAEAEE